MYYDGKDAIKVADGFGMANGINISPDKQYLYVASTFEQHIRVYHLLTETKLQLKKLIPVASLVDNIKVQEDTGDLWIGANYNGYKFIFDEGRAKGVAQVLWIHFSDNLDYNLKEVLMDDGKILQGSSVATYHHGNLLVGTANGKMLFCEVLAF
ncbi:serum paraoxonase/arylesterase 2-like [Amphiura filiformis]|uniref:serum paraoxonase/arylesterase 2-like n=1 Tax=Amphiura filiformis TaxID=82378 RepID=UPI003B21A37A